MAILGTHYFAYGSNLHPMRLSRRVPSSKLVSTAALQNYSLAFHKIGKDGSAKCDVVFSSAPGDQVFGALYSIDPAEIPTLDEFEGCGYGYQKASLTVVAGTTSVGAWAYLAQEDHTDPQLVPFDWYKELVLLGAAFHQFPQRYVDAIELVPTNQDPDPERREREWTNIQTLSQ